MKQLLAKAIVGCESAIAVFEPYVTSAVTDPETVEMKRTSSEHCVESALS